MGVKARPELEPFFKLNYESNREQHVEEGRSTRVELHRERDLAVLVAYSFRSWLFLSDRIVHAVIVCTNRLHIELLLAT
jgi:hypothetical protein